MGPVPWQAGMLTTPPPGLPCFVKLECLLLTSYSLMDLLAMKIWLLENEFLFVLSLLWLSLMTKIEHEYIA